MHITHRQTQHSNWGAQTLVTDLIATFGERTGCFAFHDCAPTVAKEAHTVFVCLQPGAVITGTPDTEIFFTSDCRSEYAPQTMLTTMMRMLRNADALPAIPALAGFFAYEFGTTLEDIPRPEHNPLLLPDYQFFLYQLIIEIPLKTESPVAVHHLEYADYSQPLWECDIDILNRILATPASSCSITSAPTTATEALLTDAVRVQQDEYAAQVEHIRDCIENGDVYQVNLSHALQLPFHVPAADLYAATIQEGFPAQGSFLRTKNSEDVDTSIISASPETFFRKAGNQVSTSPIKGTISATDHPDLLCNSEKNNAELAMIVDLLRNDLGKIALPGSVSVLHHARLQTLEHVHHLVSDIIATLPPETGVLDIIQALFPCGSITGAPKIAAMQKIAEIEQEQRGMYTGSIGYITPGEDACFSVAIRTAVIQNDIMHFRSGGGIVYRSHAEEEYAETIVKARSLLTAYERAVMVESAER